MSAAAIPNSCVRPEHVKRTDAYEYVQDTSAKPIPDLQLVYRRGEGWGCLLLLLCFYLWLLVCFHSCRRYQCKQGCFVSNRFSQYKYLRADVLSDEVC